MLACLALALFASRVGDMCAHQHYFPTNQVTGDTLTLRGSGGGLSWDKGVLLAQSASNTGSGALLLVIFK